MSQTSPPEELYGSSFYDTHRAGAAQAAAAVVPVLVGLFGPRSVVDIGCGEGSWLSAFRAHGIEDVMGVEGPWAANQCRALFGDRFIERDLTQSLALPRTFDLALCLEVVEHLPADAAEKLAVDLTRLAPIVVFSAAIPFQGGDGHVSERWADHWSALFEAQGFELGVDLRWRFWTDERIPFWYRQNMLCYVDRRQTELLHRLKADESLRPDRVRNVVHPELYLRYCRDLEHFKDQSQQLKTWLDRANNEIANVRSELAALRAELHGARCDLGDARWNLERAREEISEIKSSRSWRLIQRVMPVVHAVRRVMAFLGLQGGVGRTDR